MPALSDIDFFVVTYTLGIFAAIVISPGTNFALVSRMVLQGRNQAAIYATIGSILATSFYAILTMVGVAAVLNQIAWLVRAVQICGGLYLIYLGLMAWLHAGKLNELFEPLSFGASRTKNALDGLKLGITVELSNPKSIAFYVGLYAVAIPIDASFATRSAILLGSAAIQLTWYCLIISIFSRAPFQKLYQRWSEWIERTLGTVLIAFGLRMVVIR